MPFEEAHYTSRSLDYPAWAHANSRFVHWVLLFTSANFFIFNYCFNLCETLKLCLHMIWNSEQKPWTWEQKPSSVQSSSAPNQCSLRHWITQFARGVRRWDEYSLCVQQACPSGSSRGSCPTRRCSALCSWTSWCSCSSTHRLTCRTRWSTRWSGTTTSSSATSASSARSASCSWPASAAGSQWSSGEHSAPRRQVRLRYSTRARNGTKWRLRRRRRRLIWRARRSACATWTRRARGASGTWWRWSCC